MKRRKFLQSSIALIGGIAMPDAFRDKDNNRSVRFGIVSDVHYAVEKPNIGRYYKQSLKKLAECVNTMNKENVDFLIELGDFIDGRRPAEHALHSLNTIEKEFQRFNGPCYHVLGNHEEINLSKQQVLSKITNDSLSKAENYYSFREKSFQFIVLDANFTSDNIAYNKGNYNWKDCHVPQKQLEWMKGKLQNNNLPAIIFLHQRLDRFVSLQNYCPDNSGKVRKILENAGNVLGVFQAHDHRGGFNSINNIPYYTSRAMVQGSGLENNSYGIVEISEDFEKGLIIKVKGYEKEKSIIFA